MNINPMTFAARDFSLRRGASDEHIPPWICKERATKSGRKRPAALRVAPNLACGFVARRSQPHLWGMLPPRATDQIGRNERHRIYVHDHLEAVIETHRSGSRFWLQGADGEALRSEGRMQNAECRMKSRAALKPRRGVCPVFCRGLKIGGVAGEIKSV